MGDIIPNQGNGPEPTLIQITSLFQTRRQKTVTHFKSNNKIHGHFFFSVNLKT